MILGDRIRKLRTERGLIFEQLARRCSHSPGMIRWLEAGKSEPRPSSLNTLARNACMLFR